MASNGIDVYVKLPSGKAIELKQLPANTVRDIAQKVAEIEKVPERRVRLKYQGKTLDKNKTIGFLGICAETILKGEVLFPKDIQISIKHADTQHMETVQSTDTMVEVKGKIATATGIPVERQTVKTGSAVVSRMDVILADLGLSDGTVLTVTEKQNTIGFDEETEAVNEEIKDELMSTFDARDRPVEVVFCFDTTGSMYSCIERVRRDLQETCSRLLSEIPGIRIGIMANGDYSDSKVYVVRYVDLTTNVNDVCNFANTVPRTGGGGNGGEAYEWALRRAQQLDWSENSAKALVMIGDEPPHHKNYTDQHLFWMDELDVLIGMGVKVYGVQAMSETESTPFYQELSDRSGGFYLKMKDFKLITDMFLAVCYREADDGQLEEFVEEVEREGRMCEDTKEMLDTLVDKGASGSDQSSPARKIKQERYVAQPWWDPSLLTKRDNPEYKYQPDVDSWVRADRFQTSYSTSSFVYTNNNATKKKPRLTRFLNIFKKSRD
ncbi:uncharacterized protein LOC128228656 isoform X2 [Mya arenaria]|uniref:uncharacterized protein LOC128228656 isoform X2 n=1 Tax=Mya arenaria TaxID=6604 RepID=UPI0022DEBE85|nr:uncharacterized protein LOC128228656 isoform X2 [Mya arenaria]